MPRSSQAVGGPGNVEVLADCGLLVPPNDVSALQNAVLELVGDRAACERFGARARERATKQFDLKGIVVRYLDFMVAETLSDESQG